LPPLKLRDEVLLFKLSFTKLAKVSHPLSVINPAKKKVNNEPRSIKNKG
jgi:hypothetical protein